MKKSTQNFCFADTSPQTFGKILPSVELRSKTVKAFEGQDEEFLNAIIKSCYEFCQKSFKEARQFLWKMKFDREEALNCLGFTMDSSKEYLLLVSETQAEKIYNEFRFQYTQKHDGFLNVELKSWCKSELAALKKAVDCDPVVFFTIVSVCERSYGKNHFFLDTCINSLLSNNHQAQFKALVNLGFSQKSAHILLPYSYEIANLLKTYVNNYKKPKILFGSEIKPESVKELSHEKEDISQPEKDDDIMINVDTLLKNRNKVQAFIKLNQSLYEEGIDGMNVLKKIDVIQSLYEAVNNLST